MTTAAAVVTVPVVVAALALVDDGFPLARLDLNDGGVWLTATNELRLGRYNVPVEELNGGLVTDGTTFDVLQDAGDVLLVEPGTVSVVDPATVAVTAQVAVPGAQVSMAAGTVGVLDGDGDLWVRPVAALDGLSVGQDEPDLALGDGAAAVVARTGHALAVSAEDGTVSRLEVSSAGASTTALGTLPAGPVDQLTAVGDEPVVLTGSTLRTLHGSVELDGDDLVLQQPGPASGRVLVASRTALLEVPLDGGPVVAHPTRGDGVPAAPVDVAGCAYGAWASARGSALVLCERDDTPTVRDLEAVAAGDELVFRVNRSMVVLNDAARGRLWLPQQDAKVRVPSWQDVVPQDEPEESPDETEAPDTTQDLVTECSSQSSPPTATDDEFGVRPGRTTLLPVIDNDASSDCGILVISQFDQAPASFGHVQAVYGGRALQVAVAPDAAGTVELTYTITDGRGTSAPSTATVRLRVHDATADSPPQQARVGSLAVEQGGQAEHDVLADFVDPDGDDLLLVGASVDPEHGSVRFRQDGSLTFRADGPTLGRALVTVQVSDGTSVTSGELDVDVRPAGSVPPRIDPVHAVTYVDLPVTLHPLDAVRSGSQEPPRLADVGDVVGATLTPDLQAGTFTFQAARAGTYYVPFTVTATPQQATGLARIDVKEWPQSAEPPVAVRDRAFLPAGGEVTIDPLENDSDPSGAVLVLQQVTVPDGTGLRVAVLDHRLVQIRGLRTLETPVVLTYTVSNGVASADGEIVVHPVPASSTSQPPVVENVEVSVRTGGVVTIPVLESAYDPDGDRLTLVPELAEPLGPGEGLLFVSGDVLRYQAPAAPLTARAVFSVRDATGNVTAATLTVRVHASDPATKEPPRPRDLTARVFAADSVRIEVPLVGIDPDGDGVTLLGVARAPQHGRVTAVGPDWIEYEALPGETGTDEFTYAVEDWVGQRAVATIRVGIAPRPTGAAPVVARDDAVTVRPGQVVEVRVLANDIDSSGGQLTLDDRLEVPDGITARVEGRRVIVQAPDTAGVFPIAYAVQNGRGGRDTAVLTVTVDADAPVLAPVARDVVVPALDTLGLTEVAVDVLAVAQNPSGPLSDLEVSVPAAVSDVARVSPDGQVVVTLVDHAQTVPYLLTNTTAPAGTAESYAFITVPALGFFPPTPRPKAPALRVASGETLEIPLDEQVQVAPGRTASIADPTAVTATKSDGSALVQDGTTLRFTSADGYAGPASITVPVTDARGPDDTGARTSVITLQITVFAVEDHPPTFTPSTIDVDPGAGPTRVDLRVFTVGPEGATATGSRYSYQLTSAVPAGFTASLDDGVLQVSADASTPKGRTAQLPVRIGYGRSGRLDATVDVRVTASSRPRARVLDRTVEDGVEGRATTVDVLESAYNPFPDTPLTVVGATVETPDAGTATVTDGTVSVRPAVGFIGHMVTRFVVRDATGDPDRQVEGRVTVVVRGKPATPTMPRVEEVRDRTVVLSWDPPDNRGSEITGYRVTAQPGDVVRECASTTCTIDGLTNDVEYRFTVEARNAVDWSAPSPPSAPARPDAVPEAPGTPELTPGDGTITARWDAPVTTGSPVTSYSVEITPAPPSGPAVATATSTQYTFRGLVNGTRYTVRVRAHNRAPDPSPWSPSSTPQWPAGVPDAPQVTATRYDTPAGGQITVQWTPPEDNGDALRRYELVVTSPGGDDVPGTGTYVRDASETQLALQGIRNGVEYRIALRAENRAGWSEAGTASAVAYGVPRTPRITAVTGSTTGDPGGGSVAVAWDPPDDNGSAITTYRVRFAGSGDGWDVSGTSTTIGGRPGGQPVAVQVRACNAAGCGDWSDAVSGTPVTRPEQPSGVTLGDPQWTDGTLTQLVARWSPPASWGGGADPQYTVRFLVDGEVARRFSITDPAATSQAWNPGVRLGGPDGSSSVTLAVEVVASTRAGDASSSRVTTTLGLPAAVDAGTVSLDSSTTPATVRWQPPRRDGGTPVTGYQVELGWDGTWEPATWTAAPELALPTTVPPGTQVSVRVRAVNAFGPGPAASAQVTVPSAGG